MDLQEQRIMCLRIAIDMGCKADAVVGMASELMKFVTNGDVPSVAKSQSEERSADAIAACGTALPAAEAVDLTAARERLAARLRPRRAVSALPPSIRVPKCTSTFSEPNS